MILTENKPNTEEDCQLLARYLAEQEDEGSPWLKKSDTVDPVYGLNLRHYVLRSQLWPKEKTSSETSVWEHKLTIYFPLRISSKQALLFINGGTCHEQPGGENTPAQSLNFSKMAAETESIVIDLQDVPNQYLILDDQVSRKGDALLAYTWGKYLSDPEKYEYWPLYFPMTKAVIKAMDAVQEIVRQEAGAAIEKFLLAGISKRGLTAWLAALSDDRVNALVPMAIDILNTTVNMKHIYSSYNQKWPPAFHDFVNEDIMSHLNTESFARLMRIEDPLSYIQSRDTLYKKRLSIPKYLISASGDDFFVPDSLELYFHLLPGEKQIRVLPNQGHFIDLKLAEEALLAFYKSIVLKTTRPQLSWTLNTSGALCQVVVDRQPFLVTLWEAENPKERDFRLAAGITYEKKELELCCLDDGKYYYDFRVVPPIKGWKAHFVEVTFGEEEAEAFILTTTTQIIQSEQ